MRSFGIESEALRGTQELQKLGGKKFGFRGSNKCCVCCGCCRGDAVLTSTSQVEDVLSVVNNVSISEVLIAAIGSVQVHHCDVVDYQLGVLNHKSGSCYVEM